MAFVKGKKRARILDETLRGAISEEEGARQLKVDKKSIRAILKRMRGNHEQGAQPAAKAPPPPAEEIPEIPAGAAPRSLAEVLAGVPGPAPDLGSASTPALELPPVDRPGEQTQEEIDHEAAELGREVILKIRAGMVRTALRYFAGVNPNDPEILDLLPRSEERRVGKECRL